MPLKFSSCADEVKSTHHDRPLLGIADGHLGWAWKGPLEKVKGKEELRRFE
jgi:hypothetical protein